MENERVRLATTFEEGEGEAAARPVAARRAGLDEIEEPRDRPIRGGAGRRWTPCAFHRR